MFRVHVHELFHILITFLVLFYHTMRWFVIDYILSIRLSHFILRRKINQIPIP